MLRSILIIAALATTACAYHSPGSGGDAAGPVVVEFRDTGSLQDETSGTVMVPVVLSEMSAEQISVGYTVSGGSATRGPAAGGDYTIADGSISFVPGVTEQDIALTILTDGVAELDETIDLALTMPSRGVLGQATYTVTISANVLPRIALSMPASTAAENATTTFVVELSDGAGTPMSSAVDVMVNYSVTGTATAPDYQLVNTGTVMIPAGMMSATLPLAEVDDALDEDPETAIVTLSNSQAAVIGTIDRQDHTITDNDPTPTIGWTAASSSPGEASTSGSVTVTLSAISGRTVMVDYALTGAGTASIPADLTAASGTLTFPAGMMTQDVPYTLVNDNLDENDETAIIQLTNASNAIIAGANHTLTILDDDPLPQVDFMMTALSIAEGNTQVIVTVRLNTISGRDVSVAFAQAAAPSSPYMIAPADYTFTPTPPTALTINAGSMTTVLAVNVVEDTLDEIDEQLAIDLSGPTNATLGTNTRYTLTITNDGDPVPVVQFDPAFPSLNQDEGDSGTTQWQYGAIMDRASGRVVTVDINFGGSATNPSDYTIQAGDVPVTFTPGASGATPTTRLIRIDIVGDTVNEPGGSENITMQLTGPTNATLGAMINRTHTINDDD